MYFDFSGGTCRKDPAFWDSRRAYEKAEHWEARRKAAISMCWACPLFERCVEYVQMETRAGHSLDGIVAGELHEYKQKQHPLLVNLDCCVRCGRYIADRRESGKLAALTGEAIQVNAARGLCKSCYSQASGRGQLSRYPKRNRHQKADSRRKRVGA